MVTFTHVIVTGDLAQQSFLCYQSRALNLVEHSRLTEQMFWDVPTEKFQSLHLAT